MGVVCYLGRSLSDIERRTLLNREREALACCWCVTQCRHYLLGKFFTLETDNANNVRWVLNWNKGGKLERLGILLSEYHFRLIWKAGNSARMKVSDYLSRSPRESNPQSVAVVHNPLGLPSCEQLREMQLNDPFYSRIISKLKGNPENSRDVAEFLAFGGSFKISRLNLLVHARKNGDERIVAPPKARYRIFFHFHKLTCHLGRDKCFALISTRFWWKGMSRDIGDFVKACVLCMENKPHTSVSSAGEMVLFPCVRPWQILHIDICGPFTKTRDGHRYCLVQIDRFTRYLILSPLKTMTAEEVATRLFRDTLMKHGFPEKILHDRGPNFLSAEFKTLLSKKYFNIPQMCTTAYHAQTNARAERVMRSLNAQLRILTNKNTRNDFDEYLDAIAFSHNITISRATNHSPFFLNHGRHCLLPTDCVYGRKTDSEFDERDLDYAALRLPPILRQAHKSAAKVQEINDNKQKALYDKTHFDVEFAIGDLVNLYTPVFAEGVPRKLQPIITGPYEIKKKHGTVGYDIAPGVKGQATQRVHVQRLRRRFALPEEILIDQDYIRDAVIPADNDEIKNDDPNGDLLPRTVDNTPPSDSKILEQRRVEDGTREFLLNFGQHPIWIPESEVPIPLLRTFESSTRHRRFQRRNS